jgi:hypothetical protein
MGIAKDSLRNFPSDDPSLCYPRNIHRTGTNLEPLAALFRCGERHEHVRLHCIHTLLPDVHVPPGWNIHGYDHAATCMAGKQAEDAVKGSSWRPMEGEAEESINDNIKVIGERRRW